MEPTPFLGRVPGGPLRIRVDERPDRNQVRAVDRAACLLIALADWDSGAGVSEIAESLHLQRSTASRLLATLHRRGLLQRDNESGKYRLGVALVTLSGHAERTLDLPSLAIPHLMAVALSAQDTASIAILERDAVTTIAMSNAAGRAREVRRVYPLHATAPGKVLLSNQPEREVIRLSNAGFRPYTPNTIVHVDCLLEELARVRERGFATAFGEHNPDVNSVAIPVVDRRGVVAAALEVRATHNRISPSRVPAIIELLRGAAAAITQSISGVTGLEST